MTIQQPAAQPPRPSRAVTVQIVIGGHPLVPVPDPDVDYYRCVGQFENTAGGFGTGTVIASGGRIGILTCAHNLCVGTTNQLEQQVIFTPCREPVGSPFSPIVVQQAQMWISPGFPGGTNLSPYDYGVVRLDAADLPADWQLGPLPQMQSLTPADGVDIQVTGYPLDSPADHTMQYSIGNFSPVEVRQNGLVSYTASTKSGSSGSGVCVEDNLQNITAVHIGGDSALQLNFGVYLTTAIIQEITQEMGR